MDQNRSFLAAAGLFVVVAICAALFLSYGGTSRTTTPVISDKPPRREGRDLDALGPITDQEQAAWLAASSGFKNITDDTYDSTWITANDAATKGIPVIKASITSLNQLRPPHRFRQAQALLLQKFRLELALTGYVKTMTAKRDPAQFFRLFWTCWKGRQSQPTHHTTSRASNRVSRNRLTSRAARLGHAHQVTPSPSDTAKRLMK